MSEYQNISLKYLAKDHADFELVGKPALVLMHMQKNLVGAMGGAMPNWIPRAKSGIDASGMVEKCKELADTFRAKGLPVVFVQADGNPIKGAIPAYGTMFPQVRRSPPMSEETRHLWDVIDEMAYNPETDYKLLNWMLGAFTESGLDVLLKTQKVDTIVWGGFAQNSAIINSCIQATDRWYNNLVPVDASYICVPKEGDWHENADEVVAEAVVRYMITNISRPTDTATILEKIKYL